MGDVDAWVRSVYVRGQCVSEAVAGEVDGHKQLGRERQVLRWFCNSHTYGDHHSLSDRKHD